MQIQMTIWAMLLVAMFIVVCFVAFLSSMIFKNIYIAAGMSAAILFSISFFIVFYIAHPIAGFFIWHLIAVSVLGALITAFFGRFRKRRSC